jgi:hypothetical protein
MKITPCENIENVGEHFVTSDELEELGYSNTYIHGDHVVFKINTLKSDVDKWITKLNASNKLSIVIEDDELISALRNHREILENGVRLRGKRLGYYKPAKPRKKKRATKGDANTLFLMTVRAIGRKYNTTIPHVPLYYRDANLFIMFKTLISWRDVRKNSYYSSKDLKFCKYVWDNPKEFFK